MALIVDGVGTGRLPEPWRTRLRSAGVRIGKAEQEKLGPAQPLTDEEAEVAAAFWYSIAAGEFKVLSP